MTHYEILELPVQPSDSGTTTVRGYLVALLGLFWDEKEEFSSKRPFGYSGWEYELALPLVTAGVISGSYDEDGYLKTYDKGALDRVISEAITALRTVDT